MTARSFGNGQPIHFQNGWRWTDTNQLVDANLRNCENCVDKDETISRIKNLIVEKMKDQTKLNQPANAVFLWEVLEALNGDQS